MKVNSIFLKFSIILLICVLASGCTIESSRHLLSPTISGSHTITTTPAGSTAGTPTPDLSSAPAPVYSNTQISISSGGVTVFPYEEFCYSTTYRENGWMNADGFLFRIEEIKDKIPELKLGDDISINILDDGFNGLYYDVYSSDFKEVISQSKQFNIDTLRSLGKGTFYLRILTQWKGKYIEKEKQYESSGIRYHIKLIITQAPTGTNITPTSPVIENSNKAYDSSIKHDISITSGEATVFPYSEYCASFKWDGKIFVRTNGICLKPEVIKENSPQIKLGNDIIINILNNGFNSLSYEVFNSEYNAILKTGQQLNSDSLRSLSKGTYYIRLSVYWEGKYINEKKRNETIFIRYYIRHTIE